MSYHDTFEELADWTERNAVEWEYYTIPASFGMVEICFRAQRGTSSIRTSRTVQRTEVDLDRLGGADCPMTMAFLSFVRNSITEDDDRCRRRAESDLADERMRRVA